ILRHGHRIALNDHARRHIRQIWTKAEIAAKADRQDQSQESGKPEQTGKFFRNAAQQQTNGQYDKDDIGADHAAIQHREKPGIHSSSSSQASMSAFSSSISSLHRARCSANEATRCELELANMFTTRHQV